MLTSVPASVFHTPTSASSDPLTTRLPSGERATAPTASERQGSVRSCHPPSPQDTSRETTAANAGKTPPTRHHTGCTPTKLLTSAPVATSQIFTELSVEKLKARFASGAKAAEMTHFE